MGKFYMRGSLKKKTLYVFKKENTSHLLLQSPSPSVPSNLAVKQHFYHPIYFYKTVSTPVEVLNEKTFLEKGYHPNQVMRIFCKKSDVY